MHFTDEDWQDFENLVFSILFDILKIQYKDIIGFQTQARKDGGIDGRFYLSTSNEPLLDDKKSMVYEVKLRNNKRKDLPLSDFSKSIIIAINMAVNALTIATNLDFSKNTNQLLSTFSDKSGLIINQLSGNEIRNWLDLHTEYVKDFENKELLNFIRNCVIDNHITDEKNFKIIFRESDHKGDFLNEYRKNKCNEIVNDIYYTTKSILLTGEAGVGKSFLIDKILDELTNRNVQCISISLKDADTPRTIFIRILSNIWHISEEYLLCMETEDLREAVCRLGTTEIGSNLVEVILCSFEKSKEELSRKADIYNRSIILYLKKLLHVCTIKRKMVFCIANINVATIELLDFLCQLTKELVEDIQLILEVRTSEYIDVNMDSKDWSVYEKKLKNLSNCIQEYEVKRLHVEESYQYIDFLLTPQKLSFEAKNKIIKYAGNNPLFLKSFVDYIKLNFDFQNNPKELWTAILSSTYVENKLEIVNLLINKLAENNPLSKKIFLLLKFFSGNVKEFVLQDVLSIGLMDIPSDLVESDVIFIGKDEIKTSHLIYQEIIDACLYASYSSIKILVKDILAKVESYEMDHEKLLELKFKLYEADNNSEDMIYTGLLLGKYKYSHGQYSMCAKYIDKCLCVIDRIYAHEDYYILKVRFLEYAINVDFYTKNNLKKTEMYIQQLEEILNEPSDELMEQQDFCDLYTTYLLIMNQYYHHKGDFKKTYITIRMAKNYITVEGNNISKVLAESVWVEYLIAEKEINGIIAAIKQVDSALKNCRDSAYLHFTINTLYYTYYYGWNPELALNNIEKNIGLYDELALAEIYHNKIHHLNARFNLKKYENDNLLKEAENILKETHKAGLKNETGRVENIIGIIYLAEGNLEKAKEFFVFGMKNYADSTYVSNEWPIIANYCSVLFEMHSPEAIIYWEKVIDILLEHYTDRINKINFENGKYPKYYAIFYILINQCNSVFDKNKERILPYFNKIRQNIFLPQILELLAKIEKRTFVMDSEFESSIYMQGRHFIMGY